MLSSPPGKSCNFSRLESYAHPYYRPMQLSLKLDWPNYYGTYDETYGLRFSELEPEALSELYSDFLRYAVEYRHPFKDDFTREEICTAVAKKGVHQIGISRFYPDGPYLYYNDLCNVTDKKSLCYRTLYEIMVREEALFGISDTEDHFFFMDMLGRNCEFSCQFFDLDEDGHPRYYHLADGEKIYDGRRPRIDIDDEFTLLTGFYLRHS